MKKEARITGRVVSGARKSEHFTRLEWVVSQCQERLGFSPYPGTLNIEISPESMSLLERMEEDAFLELVPPDPSFCAARIIPVSIGPVAGAIVIPAEEVRIHGANVVEIIAPVRIRDRMNLQDGDEVTVIAQPRPPWGWLCLKQDGGHRGYPVRAVIFDLDGTLLDTVGIYLKIVDVVLERLGFPAVSRKVVMEAAVEGGFIWDMVFPEAAKGTSRELRPRIRAVIEEVSPALFSERASLIPGSESLLKAISAAGAKLGIVTSTRAAQLGLKLSPLRDSGLEAFFHTVVTADDVARQKPAPDPLLECARRIEVSPGECVYVGDMRIDIRAGKAAGMRCVGVLTGFDTYSALEAEGSDLIVDSVADLQEKLGL